MIIIRLKSGLDIKANKTFTWIKNLLRENDSKFITLNTCCDDIYSSDGFKVATRYNCSNCNYMIAKDSIEAIAEIDD